MPIDIPLGNEIEQACREFLEVIDSFSLAFISTKLDVVALNGVSINPFLRRTETL